jgi:uncharacterized protein (UPF0548 family)
VTSGSFILSGKAFVNQVFFIGKPSQRAIDEFLAAQRETSFSYPEVGATCEQVPSGYTIDHNRLRLGTGREIFEKASAALRRWQMFRLAWVELYPLGAPIQIHAIVGILIHHFGFYSLNAARIVYVIDEKRRFGFAYGTLEDHAEQGEERFSIEWSTDDDSVWYDILAFSQPRQWQARIGKPAARLLQKRFVRDSMVAMKDGML